VHGVSVWLQCDPEAGHDQAGHRLALVLSPARYNESRGMMMCCPTTSCIKGYVYDVIVSQTPPSAVLADQVKTLAWRTRGAVRTGNVPRAVLAQVVENLKTLLAVGQGQRSHSAQKLRSVLLGAESRSVQLRSCARGRPDAHLAAGLNRPSGNACKPY
jgi:mRNA interferase MazF